ncbi:hypothetical protein FBU59_005152, partial [Linderina macrospora]
TADEESPKQKPAKEDKARDSSDSSSIQAGGNKSHKSPSGKDVDSKNGRNSKVKPGGDSNVPLADNAAGSIPALGSALLIPLALAFRSVF